jgi:Domain of unknown function (DUF4922)
VSWSDRLIQPSSGGADLTGRRLGYLAAAVDELIAQQKRSWPQLAAGYAALAAVRTRAVSIGSSRVVLQHNPGRIRNTTADVAAAAAGRRPCFLCPTGLPLEERGLAFGRNLVILCNPFPILDRHLSIVHREHVPQTLDGGIATLLELAEALGPQFFVLYNGARCGASAPDHLHLQACGRDHLPIEEDAGRARPEPAGPSGEGIAILRAEDCGRSVVVLRAHKRAALVAWAKAVLGALPSPDGGEPLVNLIAVSDPGRSSLYVFPRTRHRPAAYFAQGEERMLVSPGAIDMAGLVVLPDQRDFERLDAGRLAAVFQEVSLPTARVAGAVLKSSAAATPTGL